MLHKLRCLLNRNRGYYCETEISSQKLEQIVEKGAILLDVRSPQEFEEGHLENAISLPEYEIKQKVLNIVQDKSQLIIVYCSSGHRSKKALITLKRLGYKNAYNLCDRL